jgi:hypothetical protein
MAFETCWPAPKMSAHQVKPMLNRKWLAWALRRPILGWTLYRPATPLIGAGPLHLLFRCCEAVRGERASGESIDACWHSCRSNKRGKNIHEENHFRCGFWRCTTRSRQLRKRTRTGTGSSSSGTSTNQCWDLSSNVVRDRSGTDATGPSGNSSSTVGSTTSSGSSSSSGSGTSGSGGTSSGASASARPAGMPNC